MKFDYLGHEIYFTKGIFSAALYVDGRLAGKVRGIKNVQFENIRIEAEVENSGVISRIVIQTERTLFVDRVFLIADGERMLIGRMI